MREKRRKIFSTECTYLPGFYSLIVGGFDQSGIKLFTMRGGCLSRRCSEFIIRE
jgi:hypothetical protein